MAGFSYMSSHNGDMCTKERASSTETCPEHSHSANENGKFMCYHLQECPKEGNIKSVPTSTCGIDCVIN